MADFLNKNSLLNLGLGILYRYLTGDTEQEEQKQQLPELAEIAPIIRLKHKRGAVVILIGRRESGKSVAAYRIADILDRPTYAVSPEQTPPSWVTELKLEELNEQPPPGSVLILDDVPVYMGSRDYQNSFVQQVERLIPVVRHKRGLILIFSTQSSAQSDKYILDSDLILLKPANLLFADLERSGVAKLYKQVMPVYDQMSEYQQKRHIFVFSQSWKGLAGVSLPKSEQDKVSD
ncbi:unnamed protein product [marine sediment metagenome]|uniref:Uncharacterized protein n=1 Tax=marine sediment metagenome TaxID=412755 RepID=X0UE86_9ZZZZ